MKRVLWVIVVAGALAAGWPQPTSASPASRRIVVVSLDGTSLSSWRADDTLRGVLEDGAAGLLAARGGGDSRQLDAAREAAYATLAAGSRSTSAMDAAAPLRVALREAGVPVSVSSSWGPYLGPSSGLVPPGASGPKGLPEPETPPRPSVAFLAQSDSPPCNALCIANTRRFLETGDVLIVIAPVPASSRVRDGVWLGVVGMFVVGSPPGMLTSATTRRDGVVALIDIAPTILSLANVRIPSSMDGRAVEQVAANNVLPRLSALESDFIRAAHARRPSTRAWMIAAMIVLGGAIVVRRPSPLRVLVECALAALPAVPAALLLVSLLPSMSPGATAAVMLGIAGVTGVVARAFLQASEAVAATASLSALIVLGDVVAGGALAARSPVSYLIAGGLRFYGIGNELMGVVLAGVIAAGSLLDRPRLRTSARFAVPLVAALTVGIMAAPSAGAKFGAVLVAVPVLAVLVLGLAGRKPTLRLAAAIGAFTVVMAGAVYFADRLATPAAQSHIGRATGGGIGDVVGRKIDAALGIAALSIWMQTLIVCALVGTLIWRTRRVEAQAIMALRPAVGAAMKAAAVAVVLAPVTNDAGLIASAVVAVTATALFLGALGTHAGVRPPGSQAELGFGGSAPAQPG